jgi:hypothetical protein
VAFGQGLVFWGLDCPLDTVALSVRAGAGPMNETYSLDRVSETFDRIKAAGHVFGSI